MKSMVAPDTIIESNSHFKDYADNAQNPMFKDIGKFDYFAELKTDPKETAKLLSFADEKVQKTLDEQKKILLDSKMVDKDMKPQQNITEEMQKNLAEYNKLLSSTLREVQDRLQDDTQSIMRQRTLTSPIQGLASYFDSTTINDNVFSKQLSVNPSESFSIADDVLHMKEKVGDADVGFHYNLKNPDAQLQSDDTMHLDPISKTFALGADNG